MCLFIPLVVLSNRGPTDLVLFVYYMSSYRACDCFKGMVKFFCVLFFFKGTGITVVCLVSKPSFVQCYKFLSVVFNHCTSYKLESSLIVAVVILSTKDSKPH